MWRVLLLFCAIQGAHCFAPRIVGGQTTSIEKYPYQVAIIYNGDLQCGGSIINQNWVLTAAHCIIGLNIGGVNIRVGSDYYNKGGTLITKISSIVLHNKYNPHSYDFDALLIKLPSPLVYSKTVQPIALAQASSVVKDKENAVATGWGLLTPSGSVSTNLQTLTLPIVNQNECEKIFKKLGIVTENMICAGVLTGGKDTCVGDSGGPLVYQGVQIGIVSWGTECAKPGYPGVYTRVSAIRSWIKEKTNV